MATVSNAGSGMSMSNLQRGTRGMSASDWIRMKRIQGAQMMGYSSYPYVSGVLQDNGTNFNKDISPPQFNQRNYSLNGAINVFPTVGTSKIRRTASTWTDYRAVLTADYLTYSQAATTGTSTKIIQTRLCGCTQMTNALNTKQGICTKCNLTTHVRIM